MIMQSICLIVLAVLGTSSAFFLDSFFDKQEEWNGLKVTWGPVPLGYFNTLPRTTADAVKEGFKKISDCDATANWRGARYVKDDDHALALLYDVNGYIAGIQTMVPSDQANKFPKTNLQPPFVKDGNNFVLSAYFVDPSIICNKGRSADDFEAQGTGTNLYIQNGTNAEKDSLMIPHKETGMPGTKWVQGKCFYTMGVHYWYDISDDMSCDDFFPVFLLYNKGELTAFGWALGTDLTSSRFEHPGPSTYGLFMKSVPKCLLNQGTLSTMHIYLTDSVLKDTC